MAEASNGFRFRKFLQLKETYGGLSGWPTVTPSACSTSALVTKERGSIFPLDDYAFSAGF
jgi:hypothetical protein